MAPSRHSDGAAPATRRAARGKATAEGLLLKAMAARSPAARGRWAQRGLGLVVAGEPDKTTRAMLMRQIYLSHYELERFGPAQAVALDASKLGVLADVLYQDAARAALGEGDAKSAIGHLRRAVERAPAARKPFHLWTLGSVFFLSRRYAEAVTALQGATRQGGRERPLYRAHLALVRLAMGQPVEDMQGIVDALAAAPCARGYGEFVLGHLAYAAGVRLAAQRYLGAFIRRIEGGRRAVALSLRGELEMARATLAKLAAN